MKVLYIAGYGRSGSTILDMTFSMQNNAIGVGELTHIFQHYTENQRCSCQQPYTRCSFWSRVIEQWQAQLPGISVAEAAAITADVQKRFGGYRTRITPSGQSQLANYGKLWRTLFALIAQEANAGLVVDSTKSTRGVTFRPLALQQAAGLDVMMLHLVRDPRAVMHSYLRGNNILLEQGETTVKRGGAYRMLVSWIFTNAAATYVARKGDMPYLRMRYETFVTNPVEAIGQISAKFDLDLSDLQNKLRSASPIQHDHGVAGNRVRRQGIQKLQDDQEWQTELQPGLRKLALVALPLIKVYGYPLHI